MRPSQRRPFLALLAKGYGRQLACTKLDISFNCFRKTNRDVARFRADVADAIEASRQAVEELGHRAALANSNDLLLPMLHRIDKGRQLAQARRDHLAAQRASTGQGIEIGTMVEIATRISTALTRYIPSDKLALATRDFNQILSEVAGAAPETSPSVGVGVGPSAAPGGDPAA